MKAPVKSGNFQLTPAGMHMAICIRIIDLGTTDQTYQGDTKKRHQVFVLWELPSELVEADENGDQKPFSIAKFYTLSMNEKANLRKDLESWRGASFTDIGAADFNIEDVIGKPCMLNVTHGKKQNGDDKAEISAITPPVKGIEIPQPVNDILFFELAEPFNQAAFDLITENLKKKVMESDEYKALNSDF